LQAVDNQELPQIRPRQKKSCSKTYRRFLSFREIWHIDAMINENTVVYGNERINEARPQAGGTRGSGQPGPNCDFLGRRFDAGLTKSKTAVKKMGSEKILFLYFCLHFFAKAFLSASFPCFGCGWARWVFALKSFCTSQSDLGRFQSGLDPSLIQAESNLNPTLLRANPT
jgi:hypothetical protein